VIFKLITSSFLDNLVEKHFAGAKEMLGKFPDLEGLIYTQNDHYLQAGTDKALSAFRTKRARAKKQRIDPRLGREALAKLTEAGLDGLNLSDLSGIKRPGMFDSEIYVMALVTSYFKVAFKVCFIYRYAMHTYNMRLGCGSASLIIFP